MPSEDPESAGAANGPAEGRSLYDNCPQVSDVVYRDWLLALLNADVGAVATAREQLAALGVTEEKELVLMTLERSLQNKTDLSRDKTSFLILTQLRAFSVLGESAFLDLLSQIFAETCRSLDEDFTKLMSLVLQHFQVSRLDIFRQAEAACEDMPQEILDELAEVFEFSHENIKINVLNAVITALASSEPEQDSLVPQKGLDLPKSPLPQTTSDETDLSHQPKAALGAELYKSLLLLQALAIVCAYQHDQVRKYEELSQVEEALCQSVVGFLRELQQGRPLEGPWARLHDMIAILQPGAAEEPTLTDQQPLKLVRNVGALLVPLDDVAGRIKSIFLALAMDHYIARANHRVTNISERIRILKSYFPTPLQKSSVFTNTLLKGFTCAREALEPAFDKPNQKLSLQDLLPIMEQGADAIERYLNENTPLAAYLELPEQDRLNAEHVIALADSGEPLSVVTDEQLASAIRTLHVCDDNTVGWKYLSVELARRWYAEFVGEEFESSQVDGWNSGETRPIAGTGSNGADIVIQCRYYWDYLTHQLRLGPEELKASAEAFLSRRFPSLHSRVITRFWGRYAHEKPQSGRLVVTIVTGKTELAALTKAQELSKMTHSQRKRQDRDLASGENGNGVA